MAGFGNLMQKAVYLGIGLASYASEKAGVKFTELREQLQKLADEMVERGEMTAEEARRFVDDMLARAGQPRSVEQPESPQGPQTITILTDDDLEANSPKTAQAHETVDALRQQMQSLQEELDRLKRQG